MNVLAPRLPEFGGRTFTTSPVPATPMTGLDGIMRPMPERATSISSDISIGTQGRASGVIEENAELFDVARLAYENMKNASDGKRYINKS